MRRILSILCEMNQAVITHCWLVFTAAYNIDSLTVGTTDDHSLSRITITTMGDDRIVEQITKQVNNC